MTTEGREAGLQDYEHHLVTQDEWRALWNVALTADDSLMWNPKDRFLARRRLRRQLRSLFIGDWEGVAK